MCFGFSGDDRSSPYEQIVAYRIILQHVWLYGIHLQGSASVFNSKIPETFQSTTLRKIMSLYAMIVSNVLLHEEGLKTPTTKVEIKDLGLAANSDLNVTHSLVIIWPILYNSSAVTRLKRPNIQNLPSGVQFTYF